MLNKFLQILISTQLDNVDIIKCQISQNPYSHHSIQTIQNADRANKSPFFQKCTDIKVFAANLLFY